MHEPSNQTRKGPGWTFETPFKFLGSSNKFVPQSQGTVRTLFIIGVATPIMTTFVFAHSRKDLLNSFQILFWPKLVLHFNVVIYFVAICLLGTTHLSRLEKHGAQGIQILYLEGELPDKTFLHFLLKETAQQQPLLLQQMTAKSLTQHANLHQWSWCSYVYCFWYSAAIQTLAVDGALTPSSLGRTWILHILLGDPIWII